MTTVPFANDKCWVQNRLQPNGHKPTIGKYDGKPRKHCAVCGQWLEPAPK